MLGLNFKLASACFVMPPDLVIYQIYTNQHIWTLARAPDLHENIYQLLKSSTNSTQSYMKVLKRMHFPDELSAWAL